MHTHMHVCTYVRHMIESPTMTINMSTHIYTHTHAHTHTHTRTHARTHTHTHTRTHARTRTRMHTHTRARAHTHTQEAHTCTHHPIPICNTLVHITGIKNELILEVNSSENQKVGVTTTLITQLHWQSRTPHAKSTYIYVYCMYIRMQYCMYICNTVCIRICNTVCIYAILYSRTLLVRTLLMSNNWLGSTRI